MKPNKKLTKQETQASQRIGKRLAARVDLENMSEGDILDVVDIASEAIGLPNARFHAFELKVYKTILEQKPDYAKRLVAGFLRDVLTCDE